MWTLIRCHIMWHLIRVCTVCLCPFYGFPRKYGLRLVRQIKHLEDFDKGYKPVCQFLLPANIVCHTWLPQILSVISCFLQRLPSTKNGFPLRSTTSFCFLRRLGRKAKPCRQSQWKAAVAEENTRSWTVLVEAKYAAGKNWWTSLLLIHYLIKFVTVNWEINRSAEKIISFDSIITVLKPP